ncbi:hypothetical protein D1872_270130 [compost metagenome]
MIQGKLHVGRNHDAAAFFRSVWKEGPYALNHICPFWNKGFIIPGAFRMGDRLVQSFRRFYRIGAIGFDAPLRRIDDIAGGRYGRCLCGFVFKFVVHYCSSLYFFC